MRLLRPSMEYKQQVLEYKKEFIENGDDWQVHHICKNMMFMKNGSNLYGIMKKRIQNILK